MKPKTMLCASIAEATLPEVMKAVEKAGEADLIEIRADALREPTRELLRRLLEEVKAASGKEVILTLRAEAEGGAFKSGEEERRELLRAGISVADYVDLELGMPALQSMVEEAKEGNTRVIISHHDFNSTPSGEQMLRVLRDELRAGADIAKLAVRANNVGDVLRLLEVTLEASRYGRVCTISMGEYGRLSRMASPLFGSVLTYGYVSTPTAPGQLSLVELRQALRILGVKK
jgi:3-dehydroquinate dehydratase-1